MLGRDREKVSMALVGSQKGKLGNGPCCVRSCKVMFRFKWSGPSWEFVNNGSDEISCVVYGRIDEYSISL